MDPVMKAPIGRATEATADAEPPDPPDPRLSSCAAAGLNRGWLCPRDGRGERGGDTGRGAGEEGAGGRDHV